MNCDLCYVVPKMDKKLPQSFSWIGPDARKTNFTFRHKIILTSQETHNFPFIVSQKGEICDFEHITRTKKEG